MCKDSINTLYTKVKLIHGYHIKSCPTVRHAEAVRYLQSVQRILLRIRHGHLYTYAILSDENDKCSVQLKPKNTSKL